MRILIMTLGLIGSSVAAAEDGKALYTTYCATCHGAEGKGDGAAAAALNPKPRDFSSPETWKKEGFDKDWIMKITKEGGAANGLSPLMAPFPSLTDAQRKAIADYIETSFKPKG